MASATGIPEQPTASSREDEPLLGRSGDASQAENQNILYNFVIGTGMLAQAGIWILVALVWSSVFMNEVIFFSYHPLVNSAGVLLIAQAILVLQPTATPKQKSQGTHIHFALNLSGTILLIVGLIIIEMNKAHAPETRFTSIHGILGLITFIVIILQALVGFAQFYIPSTVLGSVDNGKKLYKYHRMSGYVILLLLLVTTCAATQTGFNASVLHMQLWAVIVASVLVVAGTLPRIKKHKFGF